MTDGNLSDRDRTFAIARRANELMRTYGSTATPEAYAVWYAYVSGERPQLNEAVKRATSQHGTLTDADIQDLHERHIDRRRFATETERMSTSLVSEIEGLMETINLSLGSTTQYGASLQALSEDLAGTTMSRNRLRESVTMLIANTREVAANNQSLERRMRESRSEIEALRETLEATRIEMLTDPLTGLANRKHFEDMLRQMTECPLDRPVSLIVIDIDFFKRFNDLYGHLTGDQVLRLVAIVMREHVLSPLATLARFGGEEFGLLLPDTDRALAVAIAEQIRSSVQGRELVKRTTGESLGKVTISVGVAERRPADTAVSLLERADQYLYVAKRQGRNCTMSDAIPNLSDVA